MHIHLYSSEFYAFCVILYNADEFYGFHEVNKGKDDKLNIFCFENVTSSLTIVDH